MSKKLNKIMARKGKTPQARAMKSLYKKETVGNIRRIYHDLLEDGYKSSLATWRMAEEQYWDQQGTTKSEALKQEIRRFQRMK